jgi:light-independent protochlorophyllide reductase subunit B
VLFDTWVHPLMMGLEEHLLGMFREDFEFHDQAAASHLSTAVRGTRQAGPEETPVEAQAEETASDPIVIPPGAPAWTSEGERELRKIPFFVRGKARRNTERFAEERGLTAITVETLYDAKAHFGR